LTYFGVLAWFIGIPIILLSAVDWWARRHDRSLPRWLQGRTSHSAIVVMAVVALVYTTPWDNYLVANRIWWYDPELVTGLVVGWVPIEEYTFFVVQTWMTGLWFLAQGRRTSEPQEMARLSSAGRWMPLVAALAFWAIWLAALISGWDRGLYLSILMVWALPPIALQLAFGSDILWHHRRLISLGLLPPTLYLWVVDALAISGGTWTINPANTVGLEIGSVLPLEEAVFFLVTNTLIVFGIVLLLAPESHRRIRGYLHSHQT
jgi:lycopene cyclase domain-containing protein